MGEPWSSCCCAFGEGGVDLGGAGHYDIKKATETANTSIGLRTDTNKDDWDAAFTAAAKDTFVAEGGFQAFSEEKFQETKESIYKESYSAAFDTATQAANTAVTQTDKQGTITGNFTTTESGSCCRHGSLGRKPRRRCSSGG